MPGTKRWRCFTCSIPSNHSRTPAEVERYRLEPYVVAGDVYTHPMQQGRGGWSWYTGSAGWMYRLGLEHMLGCRRRGDVFEFDPCVPTGWSSFHVTFRVDGTTYEISVSNPFGICRGVHRATLDGETVPSSRVPLRLDGRTHHVEVEMGSPDDAGPATRARAEERLEARSHHHATAAPPQFRTSLPFSRAAPFRFATP